MDVFEVHSPLLRGELENAKKLSAGSAFSLTFNGYDKTFPFTLLKKREVSAGTLLFVYDVIFDYNHLVFVPHNEQQQGGFIVLRKAPDAFAALKAI